MGVQWGVLVQAVIIGVFSLVCQGLADDPFPIPSSVMRPPMGWNSWNAFHCKINEGVIRDTADLLVSTGLADLGYTFINIDDCWQNMTRDSRGMLQPTQWGFPRGMKALGEYIHSKGLKFGIYADAGARTCGGRPGSEGHEYVDAKTFASWGVDFLKYDNCFAQGPVKARYQAMGVALRSTGREIVYSLCEWGWENPAVWARSLVGAHLWRTAGDLNTSWVGSMHAALINNKWASYARPGGWNDPDMLQIGNGGMSESEERTQFSLWAMMKAPLIIGCDLRNMTPSVLSILSNRKMIEINQDPLGVQAKMVLSSAFSQVWSGPLSGGRQVVGLVNLQPVHASVRLDLIDSLNLIWTSKPHSRLDVWQGSEETAFTPVLKGHIAPHDVAVFIISPKLSTGTS